MRQLRTEFPNKRWTSSSINRLLKKFRNTGTVVRCQGSDRRRSACMNENIDQYTLNMLPHYLGKLEVQICCVSKSAPFARPFVKRFALCYRTVVLSLCLSCPFLSVTLVYCGQTVGRDQDEICHAGMPRPWPHCVRW